MGTGLDVAELSKNELAAEVARSFGKLRVRATGSSMLPAIWAGDVLVIAGCSIKEAHLGDVVLFLRNRRLFAHRVISRSHGRLVTQGDGVAEPDPSISSSELLGKVVQVQRRGKSIRTPGELSLFGRVTAALVRRFARAARLLTHLRDLQVRVGL